MPRLIMDIDDTYRSIEQDITSNAGEIFNRYTYYTTKYRGDRLNDINVGLFLGDGNIPTVQIFVRNKTGCIRTHIQFTRDGRNITDTLTLNYIKHGE